MKKAEKRLAEEVNRVAAYLHASTEEKLLKVWPAALHVERERARESTIVCEAAGSLELEGLRGRRAVYWVGGLGGMQQCGVSHAPRGGGEGVNEEVADAGRFDWGIRRRRIHVDDLCGSVMCV
eukprot:3369037-Rhodomonas_salina.1